MSLVINLGEHVEGYYLTWLIHDNCSRIVERAYWVKLEQNEVCERTHLHDQRGLDVLKHHPAYADKP